MTPTALRARLFAAGAVIALSAVVTACGGSGSSAPPVNPNSQKPSVEWVVHVTGTAEIPPGPKSGVGYAIIALHDPVHEVCWRFAHLHGFHNGTVASIFKGGPNATGKVVMTLSPGPALHHRGCAQASAKLMSALAAHPAAYYVNIDSVAFPHGAVRAQL